MTTSLYRSGFEAVIGLEIHAQIVSHTKLFSSAPSQVFGQEANACVSFVDAAFPGMLPVINEACVYQAVKLGLALKGAIRLTSVMERKHYFYPDNPAGYQISQYKSPLVEGGGVSIKDKEGKEKMIRLQRIHIEQDAGKSLHDQDPRLSYVDFNRVGIGLMEIVSHPDLSTPEEVAQYVKQVRCVMRYLGVCHGDMEKGQMRVDVNVSVRHPGEALGTRVEIKNMNSLRFLQQALSYEINRQIEEHEAGRPLKQETRTFDVAGGITRPIRSKEADTDYFYFPDPDLLPLVISEEKVQQIVADLIETPWDKSKRFMSAYHLSSYDAELLTEDLEVATFFEHVVSLLPSVELCKIAANWIAGELFALLKRKELSFANCPITPQSFAELVLCLSRKELSNLLGKDVLALMFETGQSPVTLMHDRGLIQVSDQGQVQSWVRAVLDREAVKVQEYLSGKEKLFAYLVGQVMKESKGKGNPQLIQDLLRQELSSRQGA
jgi:aspartyl-tRNA(Asn)/glutamyl-tRNA(Gln) amidotransferase subunit B